MRSLETLVLVGLLGISVPTEGQEVYNPPFSGVCNESSARTYLTASDFEGNVDKDSLSNEYRAEPKQWTFRYTGVNRPGFSGDLFA